MHIHNKKAVLVAERRIEVVEDEIVECPSNHVIIKVAYCGICGSDIPRYFNGKVHYYPIVLGHEFSGEVIYSGESVKDIKKGDYVAGIPLKPCMKCKNCQSGHYQLCSNYSFIGSRTDGAFQQYMVVHVDNVIKLKNKTNLIHGAFIEPMTVAIHAVDMLQRKVRPTDAIVIFGLGIIGYCLAYYLNNVGCLNISVVTRSEKKKHLCQKLGIKKVYSTLNDSNIEKFDYAFDCSISSDAMVKILPTLKKKGILQIVGTKTEGFNIDEKTFNLIQRKELLIGGSWMSYSHPWPGSEWQKAVSILASDECDLNCLVKGVYPLEEANEAFSSNINYGPKILISPNA